MITDSDWKDPGSGVRSTAAISLYSLHSSKSPTYDHILEFTNNETNYYFYDQTGDRLGQSQFAEADYWSLGSGLEQPLETNR